MSHTLSSSNFVNALLGLMQKTGQAVLQFFGSVGALVLFIGQSLLHVVKPPYYRRLILRQFSEIGFYSLPVVGLTALFTGMVLALQSYTGFSRFNAESAIATVVALIRHARISAGSGWINGGWPYRCVDGR